MRLYDLLEVLRAKTAGKLACLTRLIVACLGKADRTGGDRWLKTVHQRDYGRRIDAAAQESTQGDVAHQAELYGLAEFRNETLAPFGFRILARLVESDIPVRCLSNTRGICHQVMRGPQFLHIAIDRLG